MGLFGALDATEIKTCPEDGTHRLVFKGVREHVSQAGNNWLIFSFVMDNYEFPNYPVDKWMQYYPELTEEEQQEANVAKNNRKLIEFMLNLGVPQTDLNNPTWENYTGVEGSGWGYTRDKQDGKGKEWVLHNFTRD